MAIIPSNTFKVWRDGDVVKANEYMQELEILRSAINTNGADIDVIKNATAGVMKGVLNGTSFPPNPNTGDLFFRTDEGLLYVLNTEASWVALPLSSELTEHATSTENPHKVSASQIGAYSKSESSALFGILSGANTAGDYVKLPDGTLICTRELSISTNGASYYDGEQSFSFGFTGTVLPFISAYNNYAGRAEGNVNQTYITALSGEVFRWGVKFPSGVPTGYKVFVRIMAIGRWK